DGARQDEKGRLQPSADPLTERGEPVVESVAVGVASSPGLDSRRDQRGFRLRGPQVDTIPQPSDQSQGVALPVRLGAQRKGQEQIDPAPGDERRLEIERRRQHTDDGNRRSIEDDGPTDDATVSGEATLPEPEVEHGRRWRALTSLRL